MKTHCESKPVLLSSILVRDRYNLKEFAGYAASCLTGQVGSTPGEYESTPPCRNSKSFIRKVLAINEPGRLYGF